MVRLTKLNVVGGAPRLNEKLEGVCNLCHKGEQTKNIHKQG